MKKYIALFLTLVMVLGICTSAIAIPSPMGKTQTEIGSLIRLVPPYTDYLTTGGILGNSTLKPIAGFKIQVGTETPVESPRPSVLDVPTPSVTFAGNTPVSILPNSLPTDGTTRTIDKYDFQYRIVAEGQDRMSQPIHATDYPYYRSWSAVETAFATAVAETKALNTNAELEVYLCVADGGDDNWSANGNSAVSKVDSNFPNGIIWYFSGMVLQYKTGGPDFYPLPWGATVYDDSFKDCAMTYTADPGTAMNVPVTINNSGTQDITDMAATWYGTGWSNPIYTQKDLNIPQGGKQDILIPVTVPQAGQETRIVIQTNVDGKTPANEANQSNNMMIIKVESIIPSTDVSVSASASPLNPSNMGNSVVTFVIANNGPATAVVTFRAGIMTDGYWTITSREKDTYYTLQPGESQSVSYSAGGNPGGTSVEWGGVAEVTNTTDSNPANNMDRVKITWKTRPQAIILPPSLFNSSLTD